jgi:hypothetical protein
MEIPGFSLQEAYLVGSQFVCETESWANTVNNMYLGGKSQIRKVVAVKHKGKLYVTTPAFVLEENERK